MSYAAKLRDPRWQELRAIILARDNFICRQCGTQQNLHVHHINYRGEPWEAKATDLITLCCTCHKQVHHRKLEFLGEFSRSSKYAQDMAARLAPHASSTLQRLLARVDRENQLFFSVSDFAAILEIPKTTLEDHFTTLRKIGAIVPDPKQAHRKRGIVLWRVCPFLAWVGSGESLRAYLKTIPPDHIFFSFQQPNEDSSHE